MSDQPRDALQRARLDEYVRASAAAAPPLTPAQRDRIAVLLRGKVSTPLPPVVPHGTLDEHLDYPETATDAAARRARELGLA